MNAGLIEKIEFVRLFCEKFDKERGMYPEHEFEGQSILKFILKDLSNTNDEFDELCHKYLYDTSNMECSRGT